MCDYFLGIDSVWQRQDLWREPLVRARVLRAIVVWGSPKLATANAATKKKPGLGPLEFYCANPAPVLAKTGVVRA